MDIATLPQRNRCASANLKIQQMNCLRIHRPRPGRGAIGGSEEEGRRLECGLLVNVGVATLRSGFETRRILHQAVGWIADVVYVFVEVI